MKWDAPLRNLRYPNPKSDVSLLFVLLTVKSGANQSLASIVSPQPGQVPPRAYVTIDLFAATSTTPPTPRHCTYFLLEPPQRHHTYNFPSSSKIHNHIKVPPTDQQFHIMFSRIPQRTKDMFKKPKATVSSHAPLPDIEDTTLPPAKSEAELEAIGEQNQVNSPFLRLPSEIRNHIYGKQRHCANCM